MKHTLNLRANDAHGNIVLRVALSARAHYWPAPTHHSPLGFVCLSILMMSYLHSHSIYRSVHSEITALWKCHQSCLLKKKYPGVLVIALKPALILEQCYMCYGGKKVQLIRTQTSSFSLDKVKCLRNTLWEILYWQGFLPVQSERVWLIYWHDTWSYSDTLNSWICLACTVICNVFEMWMYQGLEENGQRSLSMQADSEKDKQKSIRREREREQRATKWLREHLLLWIKHIPSYCSFSGPQVLYKNYYIGYFSKNFIPSFSP